LIVKGLKTIFHHLKKAKGNLGSHIRCRGGARLWRRRGIVPLIFVLSPLVLETFYLFSVTAAGDQH